MRPYIIDKNFDLQRLVDANGNPVFDSASLAVYVQDPAPSIPDGFGLGVLIDAISCAVKTELNGMDELTLTYPIIGQNYEHLQLRNIIVAGTAGRGNQPYRIYRITKPLNGVVTVYARHLVYDLAGIVVKPFRAGTLQAAFAGLVNNAMTINPFRFVTPRTTPAQFEVKIPSSVWSLLGGQQGSILDIYGGEYTFDGYTVRNDTQAGADNGVSVRYGVNMTDLEQDASCADCYTGVVAYWQKEDDVVYSPVVSAAGSYGYVKILSVDMSSKFDDKPTAAQLTTAAEQYIVDNEIGIPRVSWKVEFVPLSMTEEYKAIAPLESVSLGDTVTVVFTKLGVNASARVRAIEWDVLLDRYITVDLGSIRQNIADTIATQAREIKQAPTRTEVASLSALIAAGLMGAEGGSVRFLDTNDDGEPDTLYIADNPDPQLAQKVWRFNYEGWAASANGYDGPFVMGATLEGGIIADYITAGTLTAIKIMSQDGESFYADLDSGTVRIGGELYVGGANNARGIIHIYNSSGDEVGTIDSLGFKLNYTRPATGGQDRIHVRSGSYDVTRYNSGGTMESQAMLQAGALYFATASDAQSIVINSNGTIRCKKLYINGVEVTP
jgi:phage minor structural protein